MLTDWTLGHTRRFREETVTFHHDLVSTELFSDEALTRLLEKHPADQLDVCSMNETPDPAFPNNFLTGDFRGVPAKTLMAAAKAGRIFINLRKAMNIHPEYKAVLDQMFDSLSERTGFEDFKPNGGILISSPISQTPYHFDKTETILWHIRGEKRIYIYPMAEKFIADEDYEATAVSYRVDDLPYEEGFDAEATAYDLLPGQAIAWPLNSPHRVDNSSFCVSVTTEYSTRESSIKNNNMVANAALRGKFGIQPRFNMDGPVKRLAKAGFGVALRKMGYIERKDEPDMVSFTLDPSVSGYVVPTEPFVRDF